MSQNVKLNRPELKINNKGKLVQPRVLLSMMKELRSKNFPSETCFDCQFYVRRQTCQIIDEKGGSSLSYEFPLKGVDLDSEKRSIDICFMNKY